VIPVAAEIGKKGPTTMPRSTQVKESRVTAPATPVAGDSPPPAAPPCQAVSVRAVSPAGVRSAPGAEQPAPQPDSLAVWDRLLRARVGQLTFGLSPPGLVLVYLDWLVHLAFAPGKQLDLARKLLRKALRFSLYAARATLQPGTPSTIEPLPQDQRFAAPAWQSWPFNLYSQSL
jgi:polyhydroxyalkanoate synthase